MVTDIRQPAPFLHPFPDPVDVFSDPVDRYARHLHPLCTIDLSAVDPAWQGRIHMLSPIEPYEGLIGQSTVAHHGEFLRPNWLAFELKDDRYTLLGDWRYFEVNDPDLSPSFRTELDIRHEDSHLAFAAMQAHYAGCHRLDIMRTGARNVRDPDTLALLHKRREIRGFDSDGDPLPLLAQLGGEAFEGNWSESSEWPIDRNPAGDPAPLTADGRRFRFIAHVPGYNYCLHGADSILLFYDPQDSIALFTFDWT
ncbi:hypothetical protein NU688_02195 [Variovorax sp. ZS18.2.2]|uniref:hypothetical protein n=1 Tax=Variovorax sp. ZS18.2.2 TaxID=2971255 RepID=UPI002150E5A4|nr:hypothetical protein [Variovorax sp. ZS18.2.2]MCR6474952.1 hypothetical protein [Variovorax sp. ZS18.2.2]